ncbi:hypothetical protein AVEN_118537-1 [Araneus ventricosus]|uniref:Uncharacterized protein n=1 Tax=Araneus ventricosus TaxID=182803 RepID=A0A4Y2AX55_ARAVE|nr:hypothetical protein AVEN_118537-1 [Araneus ventricosus]
MDNDALFNEYSQKHETEGKKKIAHVKISNTSRQQITYNSRNSTINSAQCLTADQIALGTELERDCFPRLQLGIYRLSDRSWRHMENSRRNSITPFLLELERQFLHFLELLFCRQNGRPGQRY